MSIKILFATDMHFRAMRPISRIDESFFESQLGKLKELSKIARDVDMVIFGGDIFDRPDVPPSVVIKVMRVLSEFPNAPYTVIGNHDIYGYEGKSVESSALGILFENGSLRRLDYLPIGDKVVAYGIHAFDKTNWQLPENSDVKNIIVAHKMITDKPLPGGDCILVDDLAKATNADVVLSGDIHYPHTVELGNKLFINPGAITRLAITDRDRTPQAVVITIEDGGDIDYEFVSLPSSPGHKVFNLKDYSAKLASEAHTKDFVKTYASIVFSVKAEAHRINEVLARFLKDNNVPKEISGLVSSYYKNAETQVLKGSKEE